MPYIEIDFKIQPVEPYCEIIIAELAELGFESFVDTATGFKGYIEQENYDSDALNSLQIINSSEAEISYQEKVIKDENWNVKWEESFDPVQINKECIIYARFHEQKQIKYPILITPQMSFGTGHHETTWLMGNKLFELDLNNKNVLDMGCGTGVLAIIASKLGAKDILAVDINKWAYHNTVENILLNKIVNISVEKGGVEKIEKKKFDLILANINFNVLKEHMPVYSNSLHEDGLILFSGFFQSDIDELISHAKKSGLIFVESSEKNHWSTTLFRK